jgi:hypothetical protein
MPQVGGGKQKGVDILNGSGLFLLMDARYDHRRQ